MRSFGCEHRVVDSEAGLVVTGSAAADLGSLIKDCRTLLQQHHAKGSLVEKQEMVANLLRERGVAELLPVVLGALEKLRNGVLLPTQAERVEALLRAAGRPMTFAELLAKMQPI